MLTLLRAEDFRRTLQRTPVELAKLIEGVVDQVRPFIHARHLQVEVDLAPDLGTFEIDPDKITAVFVNLMTNAIKFTPDCGRITLRARLDDDRDQAVVEIEDRGVGLEADALEHLFQPFFTQFDPSLHSSGDFGFQKRGLGLGLSIAKQFVEMHGGAIMAESLDGGGTRLTVRLPRIEAPAADPTAPPSDGDRRPSPNRARSPRRIIEDRPALRREREPILA